MFTPGCHYSDTTLAEHLAAVVLVSLRNASELKLPAGLPPFPAQLRAHKQLCEFQDCHLVRLDHGDFVSPVAQIGPLDRSSALETQYS